MRDAASESRQSEGQGRSNLLWPLLSLGAAALVAFGFVLGQIQSDEGTEANVPETLALQDSACVGLNVIVQRLLQPTNGNMSSELVADLKAELPADLKDDADNLITVYSRLEDGDLAALTDVQQVAQAEQAAAAINNYLVTQCGHDPAEFSSSGSGISNSDD